MLGGQHDYQQQQLQAALAARFVFVNNKRNRMRWTSELHELFLLAIAKLEDNGARMVPGQILMAMKGLAGTRTNITLTRDQVASHLQKYRKDVRQAYGLDDTGNFASLNTQHMYYDTTTGNWTHSPVPNMPTIAIPIESIPNQSQSWTSCPDEKCSVELWLSANPRSVGFCSSASPRASSAPIPNPALPSAPSSVPLEYCQDGESASQKSKPPRSKQQQPKRLALNPQRPPRANSCRTSVSSLVAGGGPSLFDPWLSIGYESLLMDHSQHFNMLEGDDVLPFTPLGATSQIFHNMPVIED